MKNRDELAQAIFERGLFAPEWTEEAARRVEAQGNPYGHRDPVAIEVAHMAYNAAEQFIHVQRMRAAKPQEAKAPTRVLEPVKASPKMSHTAWLAANPKAAKGCKGRVPFWPEDHSPYWRIASAEGASAARWSVSGFKTHFGPFLITGTSDGEAKALGLCPVAVRAFGAYLNEVGL